MVLRPTNAGSPATSASLDEGSLPSGMSLDTDGLATGTVGAIYGTPDTLDEVQSGIEITFSNADFNANTPPFSITVVESLGGGASAFAASGFSQAAVARSAFAARAFG